MKFLCLHGYGTSGEIFEQQLSSIIRALGEHHEYVFVDGEIPVSRSELAGTFSGKTCAYYDGHAAENVATAHEIVQEAIDDEEEPFDAVFGFSQGAGLAISYILQQQILYPEKPPPFRFGVFFTPGFILSREEDYKEAEILSFLDKLDEPDMTKILDVLRERHTRVLITPEKFASLSKLSPRERELCLALVGNTESMLQTRAAFDVEESEEFLHATTQPHRWGKLDFPRFFHPVYTPQRVPFPTVHIVGVKDAPAPQRLAAVAKSLCVPDKIIHIVHPGAHEVPNRKEKVDEVVRAIEKASFMGQGLFY